MKIGLYSNPDKDPAYRVAGQLALLLSRYGAQPVISRQYTDTELASCVGVTIGSYSECDMIICLGGDGTFLSAIHLQDCQNIPIAGVNLGSVGFLPEISPDQLEETVARIVQGQYVIDRRMMLDVTCLDRQGEEVEHGLAFNDAVLSRGGKSRILTLELTIDGIRVDRMPGDGMIVSTPTGSTAYSLSAGGPIIHPDLSLMLITPICPHTLHNRSYLAADTSEVVLRVIDYPYPTLLAIDGRQEIYLGSGSAVIIRKADCSMPLVRLGEDNFYATLPQKIHARGKNW